MSQHVEVLKRARSQLVEDRRATALVLAGPFQRPKSIGARAKFIELQATIEAVDRAIADEEARAGSLPQTRTERRAKQGGAKTGPAPAIVAS